MKTETCTFSSTDGMEIYVYKWLPDNDDIKAVLQITHGSIEHALRYEHFGKWLTEKGIAVYIHDQRGHGKTAGEIENLSYFSKEDNGWDLAIEDIYTVTKTIKKEFPNKPVFLLGHSMGSFEVRDYASRYGNEINGLLLSGTSSDSFSQILQYKFGLIYIKGLIKKNGKEFRSEKAHNMAYGNLNLSRDESVEKAYLEDPYCGHLCTLEYLNEMVGGALKVSTAPIFEKTPKDLPIYIFSGEKDKVGGKKVEKVYNKYNKAGVKDVSYKIYDGAYHEVLNEINKEEVYTDVYDWMNKYL